GLIIEQGFHDRHHRDSSRNYGLYAGWLDRVIDALRVFELLEIVLFLATGAVAVETRLHLAAPEEALGPRARWRRLFWRLWYGFLCRYTRRKGAPLSCLNWGYAEADARPGDGSELDGHPERYPLQLYDALCGAHVREGHAVVDVSCGRGGGLAYVHRRYRPRKSVGVDLVG